MRAYIYKVTYKTHRFAEPTTKPVKADSFPGARMQAYEALNAYDILKVTRANKTNRKAKTS